MWRTKVRPTRFSPSSYSIYFTNLVLKGAIEVVIAEAILRQLLEHSPPIGLSHSLEDRTQEMLKLQRAV